MMMEQPPPNDGMFPPGGPGPPGMDPGPPMMDGPSMGGPPPMDMGGPPMNDMGMNGGFPPGGGMDGMDPMMDPMMQDPMMGPGPDAMMNPPYFESSEYHKEATTVSTGHDGTTGTGLGCASRGHGVVSRQSSSASMELDSVSVKKIEDAEDEYGKVKQALLSDLEDLPASPAHNTGAQQQLEGQPEFGLLSPNGLLPHPLLQTSPHLDLERISTDSRPPPQPAAAQRRSKDTLESIFGGRSAAEPGSSSIENNVDPLLPTTTATKTESRSSYFSTSDNSSRSLLEAEKLHAESHSFNLEELHPIQISSLNSNNHSNHLSTTNSSSRIPNNKLLLVEEPFPVCLSPELEEMMGFRPAASMMRGSTSAVVQPGMPGSMAASGKEVYTIPELPELEETSPPPSAAKGDPGRSRANNKGTFPYNEVLLFFP